MSNGAKIRFINNKMEVRKKDVMFDSSQQIRIIVVPYLVLMPKEKLLTEKQHLWQKNKLDVMVILLIKTSARRLRSMKM